MKNFLFKCNFIFLISFKIAFSHALVPTNINEASLYFDKLSNNGPEKLELFYAITAFYKEGLLRPTRELRDHQNNFDNFDRYIAEKDFFSIKLMSFLNDENLKCDRPRLYSFFRHLLHIDPFKKIKCDDKYKVILTYFNNELKLKNKEIKIPPQNILKVDIGIVREKDSGVLNKLPVKVSSFGHLFLRFVVCKKGVNYEMPQLGCNSNKSRDLVINIGGDIDRGDINPIIGLLGDRLESFRKDKGEYHPNKSDYFSSKTPEEINDLFHSYWLKEGSIKGKEKLFDEKKLKDLKGGQDLDYIANKITRGYDLSFKLQKRTFHSLWYRFGENRSIEYYSLRSLSRFDYLEMNEKEKKKFEKRMKNFVNAVVEKLNEVDIYEFATANCGTYLMNLLKSVSSKYIDIFPETETIKYKDIIKKPLASYKTIRNNNIPTPKKILKFLTDSGEISQNPSERLMSFSRKNDSILKRYNPFFKRHNISKNDFLNLYQLNFNDRSLYFNKLSSLIRAESNRRHFDDDMESLNHLITEFELQNFQNLTQFQRKLFSSIISSRAREFIPIWSYYDETFALLSYMAENGEDEYSKNKATELELISTFVQKFINNLFNDLSTDISKSYEKFQIYADKI